MEDKKSKRKLFKRIGSIVSAIALTIVAFSLPFLGSFSPKINSKNLVASADYTTKKYAYYGKELLYFDMMVIYNGNNEPQTRPVVFSIDMIQDNSLEGYTDLFLNAYMFNSSNKNETRDYLRFTNWDNESDTTPKVQNADPHRYRMRSVSYDNSCWVPVYIKMTDNFNCNVVSLTLESVSTSEAFFTDWNYFLGSNYNITQLTYTDINGETMTFQFFSINDFYLSKRTYYFVNSGDFTDNQIYNQGYNDGLADNQDYVYSEGYRAGETIGYNNGYSKGVESANDFTFFSLVSAVIDAPIQAFMGLFNFELLGINLAGFFTGLLTLAFIITIVRLIMP